MSLILDALNRSESERRGSGEIPGLATEHFSEPSPDGRRLTAYLPWLGLVLAIAVIAWLLLDRSEPDLGVSELSAPSEVPGAAPAPIANQPAPVANVAEAPPPAAAAAVTEATPVKKRTVSPSPAARDRNTSMSASADPAVAALYQQAPAPAEAVNTVADSVPAARSTAKKSAPVAATKAPEAVPQSEPLDISAVLESAKKEMENARLAEHPAPFIEDLSQQRKDAIPTLMYSIHNFSGKAGQSSVMINGKSLQAGGNVGKGVRLEEILPESIVLSYQGEQFRLRALNSWVNL
ncbi:MAG: general secretion pathway protein GspB [Halieaceae bacterium]